MRVNPAVVIVVLALVVSGAQRAMNLSTPTMPATPAMPAMTATPAAGAASLGVGLRDVAPEDLSAIGITEARGALVAQVLPDGAAASAGMSEGDVVLTVGRESVFRAADLVRLVAARRPGDVVELTVLRTGQVRQMPVRLGAAPSR